jgi:hypothetical protein
VFSKAIALHYINENKNNRNLIINKALFVLAPFLLSCLRWYKRNKLHIKSIIIQSLIRGFFIRRDIIHLINFLRFRKALRKFACIYLRNKFRKNISNLYNSRIEKKILKLQNIVFDIGGYDIKFEIIYILLFSKFYVYE